MTKPSSGDLPSAPAAILTFLLVAFTTFFALYQVQPPAAVPASAPPTEFSSGRAMEHLKLIAQKPHPTGSPENAKVRDYILKQFRAMGLESQVQTATVVRVDPKWRPPSPAATVNNVVAKLKGTRNTKAVMLVAHYDSVPTGPGASDDGAGVAAVLETARALKAGVPLGNDLIFLITDGEELGLLGAKAFVDEHPWAKDAAVALNFEARGACGPSLMFETSPGNRWLIREFAKAAPDPVTSSLMGDIYKRLPNDTDFTILRRAGLAGLNFAYVGCWPRYHTRGDSVENIDERSLQQQGSYALALAHHFGNLSLPHTVESDAVYFSLFGYTLFYSRAWVMPLTAMAILLFVGVVGLGLRRKRLAWRGMIFGFLAWLACAASAAVVSKLAWQALVTTHLVSLLPYGMAYGSEMCAIGFVVLTVAITSALYVKFRKRTRVENLMAGALAWWAILVVLTGCYVPGGSYLFVWPLLASLIPLGPAFASKDRVSPNVLLLTLLLPAVSGIMLLTSLIYLFMMALSTTALAILTVITTLLLGLLTPDLDLMTAQSKWLLPGGAAVVGLGIIIAGIFASRFDANHPQADSVFYAFNADTGKAVWATTDRAPDKWTSQFLSGHIENSTLTEFIPVKVPVLDSPAPAPPLAAPGITTMDDLTIGDARILRLWVTSQRQARIAWVQVQNTRVLEATVNGKRIRTGDAGSRDGSWALYYVGLPKDGIVLTLTVEASQPLEIKVLDQSDGLPEMPGLIFKPRPDDLMPAPAWPRFDSSTLVSKSFRFEAAPRPR